MSLLRIEENTKYYTRATLAVSSNNRGKLRPGVRGLVFGGSSRPIPDWDINRETIIIKQRNNIVNHHPVYRVSSLTESSGLWIVIQTFLTSLTCQLLIGNGAQSQSLTNNFWTKKLCSCKTRHNINNYINKCVYLWFYSSLWSSILRWRTSIIILFSNNLELSRKTVFCFRWKENVSAM